MSENLAPNAIILHNVEFDYNSEEETEGILEFNISGLMGNDKFTLESPPDGMWVTAATIRLNSVEGIVEVIVSDSEYENNKMLINALISNKLFIEKCQEIIDSANQQQDNWSAYMDSL